MNYKNNLALGVFVGLFGAGAFGERTHLDHPGLQIQDIGKTLPFKESRPHTSMTKSYEAGFDTLAVSQSRLVDVSHIATIELDMNTLVDPEVRSIIPGYPSRTLADPSITIDGKTHSFRVSEVAWDKVGQSRHIIGFSNTTAGSSFLFSVKVDGSVAGTIQTKDHVYRVLSTSAGSPTQELYEIKNLSKDSRRGFSRLLVDRESTLSTLESYHVRTQKLAAIKPSYYRSRIEEHGSYSITKGGKLGKIQIRDLKSNTISVIRDVLVETEAITGVNNENEIQVVSLRSTENHGYKVIYKQLINGIPLENLSRVYIDNDGQITQLEAISIDASQIKKASAESLISLEEAKSHSQTALHNLLGITDFDVLHDLKEKPHLQYKLSGGDFSIEPYWVFDLVTTTPMKGAHFKVLVNALTGEAKAHSAIFNAKTDLCVLTSQNVGIHSCTDLYVPLPNNTSIVHNVDEVFQESAQGARVCTSTTTECNDPKNIHPYEVFEQVESWLETEAPASCCSQIQDIDIMRDPTNQHPLGYRAPAAITLPNNPGVGFVPGLDVTQEDEILVHEAAHHVINGTNIELYNAGVTGGQDDWSRILNEGYADALASLYSEQFNVDANPWQIGDGALSELGDVRDATQSGIDWQIIVNQNQMAQFYGQAVSNFFYRLLQEPGVSRSTVIKILMSSLENISAAGGEDATEFDPIDLKNAVDQYVNGNSTLEAAVDSVWADMDGPVLPPVSGGGGTGGTGTPSAPISVNGSLATACSNGASFHNVFWSQSSNTNFYKIYYSTNNINYNYSFASSNTLITTYNTVPVDVKVESCNSSGCSLLSIDSYSQQYLCN